MHLLKKDTQSIFRSYMAKEKEKKIVARIKTCLNLYIVLKLAFIIVIFKALESYLYIEQNFFKHFHLKYSIIIIFHVPVWLFSINETDLKKHGLLTQGLYTSMQKWRATAFVGLVLKHSTSTCNPLDDSVKWTSDKKKKILKLRLSSTNIRKIFLCCFSDSGATCKVLAPI